MAVGLGSFPRVQPREFSDRVNPNLFIVGRLAVMTLIALTTQYVLAWQARRLGAAIAQRSIPREEPALAYIPLPTVANPEGVEEPPKGA
jgi:hypothetical protein